MDRTSLTFLGTNRLNSFAIAKQVVSVPKLPVLFDKWLNNGQSISQEFLVFRTVEFIMSPLFEWDVSADKKYQPANLLVLFLNDVE